MTTLTVKTLEQLAPDQAALSAAARLRDREPWLVLAASAQAQALWGECQGSGSNPYRVIVDLADLGYSCGCPSRKVPCKHVLALLWQRIETPEAAVEHAPPQWVRDWIGPRRTKADHGGQAPKTNHGGPRARVSATRARLDRARGPQPNGAEAPKGRRAEQNRQRARARRHEQILAGLDEFERWVADMLARGVASSMADLSAQCRQIAARLVDAKAPGLAGQVDQLPHQVFTAREAERNHAVLTNLGNLYLLSAAYRRLEELPWDLAEDVKRLIGWTIKRESLLADTAAVRITGTWQVVLTRTVIQPDDLQRIETWFILEEPVAPSGETTNARPDPTHAMLMDFHALSQGRMTSPYAPGDRVPAEMVFFPSATPVRAILGARHPSAPSATAPPQGNAIETALLGYRERLARNPWIHEWPLRIAEGVVTRSAPEGGLVLTDGAAAMALAGNETTALRALVHLPLFGIDGLWNGERFSLHGAHSALGRWVAP